MNDTEVVSAVRKALVVAPGPLLWIHNRTRLPYMAIRQAIDKLVVAGVIEVCNETVAESGGKVLWWRVVGDDRDGTRV
jgi:hypothetical protein